MSKRVKCGWLFTEKALSKGYLVGEIFTIAIIAILCIIKIPANSLSKQPNALAAFYHICTNFRGT